MKKLLLLSMLVFITGCSCKYEIYLDKDFIKENINITVDGDIYKASKIKDQDVYYIEDELVNFDNPVFIDYSKYYEKTINVNNNKSSAILNTSYEYDNLKNNYNINKCFDDVFVQNTDESIYISLSEFICELNNPIDVYVSSYYKISSTNAHETSDDNYIWHLDDTKDNNDIELIVMKEQKNTSSNIITTSYFSPINIIVTIILALTGIVVIIIYKKNSNK